MEIENNTEDTIEQKELDSVSVYAHANPDALPDQFKGDPEKFLASYKELRKTLTKTQQELATIRKQPKGETPNAAPMESPSQETNPADLTVPSPSQTTEQPTKEEWDAWGQELRTKGQLGPESRESIKKKYNIPDTVIDSYIRGVHAQAASAVQEASTLVGGTDKLKEIMSWASNNLNEQERALVNDQLASTNWKITLLGLQARMGKESPNPTANEPKKAVPKGNAVFTSNDIEPFTNRKEMTWAIRDKRYGVDPKYTEWVQNRIRVSGTNRDGI